MISRASITMETADEIASGAVAACKTQGFKPVAVTVLDASGDVLVMKRMTGCPCGSFLEFAHSKAWTAASLHMPSRQFRGKYTGGEPARFTQAIAMCGISRQPLAPFAGGVLIRDAGGQVVGSVGVSGASANEDEYCALMGVKSCAALEGCTTDPAEHSCTTLQEGEGAAAKAPAAEAAATLAAAPPAAPLIAPHVGRVGYTALMTPKAGETRRRSL